MKNKSKTGGKNLNRGRRKWFHKGEFIGLDIQSVIMTVLTMLTIAVTVVMGLLIYNRFKMSVKETNISSTEGIVDSVVEKMNSDLYNIRQISNAANYNIIQQYDVSSQEFNNQFSLLYETNSDKIQSLVLYNNEGKLMASEPISSEKKNVEIKKQDWFYNAKKEIENIHFSKPHLQNIFMDGTYKYNWVISLSRSVDINDGDEPISGILLVDMKYSIIEETFERINGNSNGVYYYLCDGNGDIIYHPRKVEIDRGIISEEDVQSGDVQVIAPEGFEKHAVSENIYAGTAMGRRASYQYGTMLEASETGALAIGIGMGQSRGSTSYISPTLEITETGEKHTIDGVEIEFQLTPGTEAPAEMNFWIGSKNALWMAENCTGTLHNLYTLRGAQVRDGNAWAEYIMESLALYGDQADVVFQSHNWPHWGKDIIQEYMTNTAAVYKFINDQTLLYINEGYTETEIANMIQLPKELEKVWYTRQYYGTVSHNSKAVYEKYMGWYDGNPVHLAELTPSDYAQKLVEYFGDTDAVLEKAKEAHAT